MVRLTSGFAYVIGVPREDLSMSQVKGTVSRDFVFASGFFLNYLPQASDNSTRTISIIFLIGGDICKSWCTTSINDTGGEHYSIRLLTP